MPYFYDPNLDQENQNGGSATSAQLAGGSSSNEAPTASGASPSGQKKELNTGSGYQNLDKYLNTNDAGQFGQKVLGKVGDTISSAQQNQAQASDQFKNQVQSANYTPDQDKVNSAIAHPEQADAKQFQQWMKQSYQGPKSLAEDQKDWNQYWSGTNQAETNANLLGSEPGRFTLLDNYFGRPQYNFGQKSLDNLLVQQAGLGDQTKSLQNQAAQLRSQGEENAKSLQGVAAQRAGEVEQSKTGVNQAFNQAQGSAQDQIAQATQAANDARLAETNALKSNLTNNALTDDQLSKLGLTRGQNIYGMNLNDYFNVNQTPLSNEQVATDEQRTRLNALAQLAGQDQTYLGAHLDPAAAYGYDVNRLNTDVGRTQSLYNQGLDQINQSLQSQNSSIQNSLNQGRHVTITTNGVPLTDQQIIDYQNSQAQQQRDALAQQYQANRRL
jgi:hypothetical protein